MSLFISKIISKHGSTRTQATPWRDQDNVSKILNLHSVCLFLLHSVCLFLLHSVCLFLLHSVCWSSNHCMFTVPVHCASQWKFPASCYTLYVCFCYTLYVRNSKSLKLEKFEVGKDRSSKRSTLQKFEVRNVLFLLALIWLIKFRLYNNII